MVKFNCTKEEYEAIVKIVLRAEEEGLFSKKERLSNMMDLEACHSNGCLLDFNKLLGFPKFDFAHDLIGIHNNINRKTGIIENCFLPRCSK